MPTFLQLCQAVTRETRTIPGTFPTSVTGQTGRLLQIVESVRDAWRDIQNERDTWSFMVKSWSGTTAAGVQRYTAASFSLTDWAAWLFDDGEFAQKRPLLIYRQDDGRSTEGMLRYLRWDNWFARYGVGERPNDYPQFWSISPQREICLGPTPNGVYVLTGQYRIKPQELTANGDVPILPERFHSLIKWAALLKIHEFDEAEGSVAYARCAREMANYRYALMRDEIGPVVLDHRPLG